MHPLLATHVGRHLSSTDISEEPWRPFLATVDETYRSVDLLRALPDLLLHLDATGVITTAVGASGLPSDSASWTRRRLLATTCTFTEGGSITIETSVAARDGAAQMRIAVRDTGIGVPAHAIARLFQDFVQVDVTSAPGVGSTFTVSLPRREPRPSDDTVVGRAEMPAFRPVAP
jgi:hypothetical protein